MNSKGGYQTPTARKSEAGNASLVRPFRGIMLAEAPCRMGRVHSNQRGKVLCQATMGIGKACGYTQMP